MEHGDEIMNLGDIISIENLDDVLGDNCGLVRHTASELGDYLIDQNVYDFYQAVQEAGKFDKVRYVLSFLVNKEGKTVFRGVYERLGSEVLKPEHFFSIFLGDAGQKHYLSLCNKFVYYHLKKTEMLSSYDMRLVLDWGGSKIAWFQYHKKHEPKKVLEILPTGYFTHFTDYLSISLTRSELEFLFNHPEGNPIWKSQLSKVGGVYLILDESDGQQYVGSAYGKDGVWGRWNTYSSNPTGNNIELQRKLASNPNAHRTFRYSILEVFPNNILKEDVIKKESLYKKKLGTRAFGLNAN
jgi:hypothetical protein